MNAHTSRVSKLSVVACLSLALFACQKDTAQGDPKSASADTTVKAQPAATTATDTSPVVTVLITGDENGYIESHDLGGAAEMLGKWKADEAHCVKGDANCQPKTIAASTGDHWGGPAISSYFFGEPVAEVMKLMGYEVSAFGNHELDFGKEQFAKSVEKGGFPYVAANLVARKGSPNDFNLKPFVIIERGGAKIAFVGLTDTRTTKTAMAGRFEGLEAKPYGDALAEAVPQAWTAGADAVVVLADACPSEIEKAIEGHEDNFKISVIAGGQCENDYEKKMGPTTLVSPGRRLSKYVRAQLTFDPTKPAGQRLVSSDTKVVSAKGAKPDESLKQAIGNIRARLDQALGEEIGYTASGLQEGSPELARWVASAIRANLKTDVALLNKKGLRAGVPPGKITKATIYSVMPFENSLLKLQLTGADLKKALAKDEAIYAGVTKSGDQFKLGGKPIDDKRKYSVATVEYLYFGGDGFEFEKQDDNPIESGQMWQTPVIEWTRKQSTSEQNPLEKLLPKS